MVVDDELLQLLDLLNGRRSLRQALQILARRTGRSVVELEREAPGVLGELKERRLLASTSAVVGQGRPLISNVTVNLTNRCNLRCSWCYNADRRTDELPVEELMGALGAGREVIAGDASFILLGGEPTLVPDRLLPVLDRAGEVFETPPLVSTNGTLLGMKLVAELAARRVEVQVSLDSPVAGLHDRVRGAGVFEKAVAGVRRLIGAGIHTILSMVYTRHNVDQIEPYLELAKELGAAEARLIPLRMIGGGLEHRGAIPDQVAVFEHLLGVLERRPELRSLLGRDYFTIGLAMCRHSSHRRSCGVGSKVVFIDADGTVYPCPNHASAGHAAGSLVEQGLPEIFLSSHVMNTCRERFQVSRYDDCKGCVFRHWCAGDCRGEVLALTGDPRAPSPHCGELKELYRRMMWLIADGDERLGGGALAEDGQKVTDGYMV